MSALRGGPHWAWTTARCPQENPWAMQRWDERGGSASRSSGQTEPQRERSDSGLPVFLGKRDECLICKVPCRTILLSKHTDSDIRALFLGIDGLCRKYSMETSQVSEFQEKHRRRLLAFYGEKISSLEESLRKSALQLEQLQSVRLAQQTAFGTIKTPVSTPTAKPSGPVFLPPDSSASQRCVGRPGPHLSAAQSSLWPPTSPALRPLAPGWSPWKSTSPPPQGERGLERELTQEVKLFLIRSPARGHGRPCKDLRDQSASRRTHGQRGPPPSAPQPDAVSLQRTPGSQLQDDACLFRLRDRAK
ncbi:probable E3 SUMO-protein ligase RNF212 isoform X3 [Vicugna pacos]|uniref:Probable E3 SUMO-protein ligase RNF212 isoform X3 n=1 Tax=Vicugna pacos TaxID=30538 RepID=A0ABM5C4P5_VICPA